ncbi:MAG: CinA family protein [Firmicutes bacterium]|nr:CinA family protein [Bacillota bacterium]
MVRIKAYISRKIASEAAELLAWLADNGRTVTFAESCTGGMLAAAFTANDGASAALRQAYVTYCDDAKALLLGVSTQTLAACTAVSAQTAAEMARGAAEKAKADVAISVTGLAGPGGGTAEQPVGLVFIGVAVGGSVKAYRCQFAGGRDMVRLQAALTAYRLANEAVKNYSEV